MKKVLSILMIIAFLSLVGCGNAKTINGKYCDTYGLVNKDDYKCKDVRYRVIVGNVIWGILLVETIVAPIYFFGFSLYEPVGYEPPEKR